MNASNPTPDPGSRAGHAAGSAPRPGDTAFVQVAVATVWVRPGLDRAGIDGPSLSVPVDLDAWNSAMDEAETLRWLTGHLETQALLGARVIVDEVDGQWARIVVTDQLSPRDPRGYPGWVPLAQLVVDPGFEKAAASSTTATVTASRSRLSEDAEGTSPGIEVSFGTVLPVLGRTAAAVVVAVPGGGTQYLPEADVVVREPGEAPPTPTVEDVIATGERFLGLRYLWSGMSAWGFDCSGFTHSVFRHHGITIPRDAGPQMTDSGLPRVKREDLRRGDLVFFSEGPGSPEIRHVALYLGDDRIIHAPNAPRTIDAESLSGYDVKGEYAGAVRAIEQ